MVKIDGKVEDVFEKIVYYATREIIVFKKAVYCATGRKRITKESMLGNHICVKE